jgi:choline dehydrogenase-like flavoprotein
LDELGHEHRPIVRNASLDDDPEMCGYCTVGCQQGCKRSALRTTLQDASDDGASMVPGCVVERVLVEDGCAVGVEGSVCGPDKGVTRLRVEAPTVVVACGGVESPALLLRRGSAGRRWGRTCACTRRTS